MKEVLGFPIIETFYRPHHKDEPVRYQDGDYFGFQVMHYCNLDTKKRLYLDISHNQFVPELPGIVIIPSATETLVFHRQVDSQEALGELKRTKISKIEKIISELKGSNNNQATAFS